MISMSRMYKLNMIKAPDLYTGTTVRELNKRQNYYNLHKKPKELERKLPTPKNTQDELNKTV